MYAGLFGCVGSGGTVQNLNVSGTIYNSSNEARTGGIAGNLGNGSTIVDCFNSGNIEASHKGGIVGWHSGGTAGNCGWLTGTATDGKGGGFSSDTINAESISDINSVVTSLSASMDKDEIEVGKTGAIALKLAPATDGFSAHSGAVEGMNAEGYDEALVTVEKDEANGTFTVTGVAEGSTEITVKATFHATDFSSQSGYVSNGEEYTFTFPVTVVAATQSNDSSSGSGSTGGGGGGGCSAGFGALALLAAVPLLFRRKK